MNGAKGSCSRLKGPGRTDCKAETWGSQSRAADSSRWKLEAEIPREGTASLPLLAEPTSYQGCTTCPPFKALFGHPGSLPLFPVDSIQLAPAVSWGGCEAGTWTVHPLPSLQG